MGILTDRYAFTLGYTYGLLPDDDAKYDPHYVAGSDVRYYTLASYKGNTNVLVKFESDDMPKSD